MTETNTGACLCGAVRFRTSGPLRGVVYCHCQQCRRQTGHFYAATNVPETALAIDGADKVSWYAGSPYARRGFCSVCGSALFWKHNDSDEISVMAGVFDKPNTLRGEVHIFVADKADYYTIDDGLPQYERSTPSIVVADD